jgi:hypothetical protein
MKLIHLINKIATYTTLVLYLLVYTGMVAQIILGPIQLILAITITALYYKKLDSKNKKSLKIYWLAVAIVPLFAYASFNWIDDGVLIILSLFVYPMYIACYFLYVTSKINKYFNSIKP